MVRKHTGIKPQTSSGYTSWYCVMCGKEIPKSRTYYGTIDKMARLYCRKCENKYWKSL